MGVGKMSDVQEADSLTLTSMSETVRRRDINVRVIYQNASDRRTRRGPTKQLIATLSNMVWADTKPVNVEVDMVMSVRFNVYKRLWDDGKE